MTALSDLTAEVNNWLNRDYDETTVGAWIDMAEDKIAEDLRIADMITITAAVISANRVELPDDWLELDLVRVVDGDVLEYVAREELYRLSAADAQNKYTLSGNYIIFGGDYSDGINIEYTYYARPPRVTEQTGSDTTWLNSKYHQLLLFTTLLVGTTYGIEDDRAAMWQAYVEDRTVKLNENHLIARNSGSMVRSRRSRSFG